ncbi:hypothetical protein KP77_20010 [Jeotgalibacillus alimentarius]|uniref:Uncharacterized protein n=1 Tax=Jeotgalibacillus alimentarius TaxID=135826 RepID=A0A0C2REZ4_9BACL|nr:hypothetical protein [Jeotgalibacillus alimentarius]KIL48790.1 hypothetical protein KP77_20010 [Jeotgalibacillus alimentarius]
MLTGFILLIIFSSLFVLQMKKQHAERNVVILFFSLAGIITGLWFVFDSLVVSFL